MADTFRERITSIERRRVGDIAHNERNPKRYTGEKKDRLTAVLSQFGKAGVLLTYLDDEGTERFFDGNTRRSLNPDDVWYIAQTDLTQAEVDDLVLFYDPLASPDWDAELVKMLAQETAVTGDVLPAMLDALLAELGAGLAKAGEGDAEPQTDRAEELRQQWGVELGQLWQIGEHRLICGDCTDRAVVERVMGGEGADGAFTSPPYAMQRKDTYGGIPVDRYVEWWDGVQAAVRSVLASDGSFFVNIKPHSTGAGGLSLYVHKLVLDMAERGWLLKDEYCWERSGMPGNAKTMGKFKNQWEPIYWFSLSSSPKWFPENVMYKSDHAILDDNYKPGLERTQGTSKDASMGVRKIGEGMVFPGNRIKASSNENATHPASFPVSLPSFFIKAYSSFGDIWLEPFAGSGTTLIACQNLNRRCRAVEISPAYCAVILQRAIDAFPGIDIHQVTT